MKWNSTSKEVITWIFAALSFIGGWGITVAGFCVEPIGEIHPTVIVIFGQAMVITGAIIGVNLRFKDHDNTLIKRLTSVIHDAVDRRLAHPPGSEPPKGVGG